MSQDQFMGVVLEGKYRLDRKIGEGGMGAVYLGVQIMVDRPVAIKLLHAGLSAHDRVKKRFEVEAKAIGRLSHPNVITLYDFGYSREIDAFYMVMEFLDGEEMHKRVVNGVAAKEAIEITRQIAAALDHAHHLKILHRDLKPENIIIVPMTDGSKLVKVLDFGIARIFKDDDDQTKTQADRNRLTRAGEVFGTPAYISPEQARGERDLTPSSDLYSLGVMLFEMLEGKLPFWGDTAIDTIMLHISAPIPVITRADVPDGLKQLTYALLGKEPSRRPQSGRELIAALDGIDFDAAPMITEDTKDWDGSPTLVERVPSFGLAEETGPMGMAPPHHVGADASGSLTDKILPAAVQLPPSEDPARSEVTLSRIGADASESSNNRTVALIALMCVAILGALGLGVIAITSEDSQAAETRNTESSSVVDATKPPADDEPAPEREAPTTDDSEDDVQPVDTAPEAESDPPDETEGGGGDEKLEPVKPKKKRAGTKPSKKKDASDKSRGSSDKKPSGDEDEKPGKPKKPIIPRMKLDDDEPGKVTRVKL